LKNIKKNRKLQLLSIYLSIYLVMSKNWYNTETKSVQGTMTSVKKEFYGLK